MPASEKTWRDQKTLHVIFGCTGLLLLISTIWMLGVDHARPWKKYQRKMRDIDIRLTQWRMRSELTQENANRRQDLMDELDKIETSAPLVEVFDEFVGAVDDQSMAGRLQSMYDLLSDQGASQQERRRTRARLQDEMAEQVSLAKFSEENLLSQRKFKAADYDVKRANYDLGIRDGIGPELLEQRQEATNVEKAKRDDLTLDYEAAADYRKTLDNALRKINEPAELVNTTISEANAEYEQLSSTLEERESTFFTSQPPFLGKRWLELPILDAFNSPLKIDNLWTKNLKIVNGSFGAVSRYDRCTTCHQAIDRSAPSSVVDPLYDDARVVEFELASPDERPRSETSEEVGSPDSTDALAPTLLSVYGIGLARHGLVNANDVTVRQVLPESLAAHAPVVNRVGENRVGENRVGENGLKVGDVLLFIRDSKVLSVNDAERYLLEQIEWGNPISVKVRRGLPQPFSSHPRLDLFVGSTSPHRLAVMGCTICHEGQGSATNFNWASHTPSTAGQQDEWVRDHGWFNNHHWTYPMLPARFAESSCLKCHHDVVELEVADFDEPPAPKLMKGYHLIRKHGCFGCHEINGYNGPNERVGPDLRLEPNYSAAAAQIRSDPGFAELSEEQRDWVGQLIQHPDRTHVRHKLLRMMNTDVAAEDGGTLSESHYVIAALEDSETPGNLRKVGPSLRYLKTKVGATWLYDWLRDPTHFRPSTRMPRFFGQYDHLDDGEVATSRRYEPIEILGLIRYLLEHSQELELIEPDANAFAGTSEEQVERGKLLFEMRGCLACHQHQNFPYARATQGPELSNIGDKFRGADNPGDVRVWMYSWLKNPSLYHARTNMPDLFLDPIVAQDGPTTDPAADIAVFLLNSTTGWAPKAETAKFLTPNEDDLNNLVREHLKTKLYSKDVDVALETGHIPSAAAATLDGAELNLASEEGLTTENKLRYIGAKTLFKYGCFACHDIPGFETAKPIGTGLADWGRKDPSKLAFEHIAEYIGHGHAGHGHAGQGQDGQSGSSHPTNTAVDKAEHKDVTSAEGPFDEQFYMDRLMEHDRTGFIWQKLKEPRSYDFGKARNKDSFNDRARMPAFSLNDEEREAVITFVLGLVAEPPAHEFVFHPNDEQRVLIAGHNALIKFNCIGCHIVDPETWTLEIPTGRFDEQPSDPARTFPFMPHQFTTAEVEASLKTDPQRGTLFARLEGMPEIRSDTGLQRILDEEGDEIEEGYEYDPSTLIFPFELWRPTLIEGFPYQTGVVPVEVEASWIRSRRPTFGGDLTHWLLPRAIEIEKESNPQADGKQAYGWLPPPLLEEGQKVQSGWLHSFLLQPFKIRPAVFMRMPRFNLSNQEATDLANYFSARDNAAFPYEYSEVTEEERLDHEEAEYEAAVSEVDGPDRPRGQTRLDHSMNIVMSSDYCVQCHIVGDFVPKTSDRAMAPDLSVVNRRFRPQHLKRWLANPRQTLPYTPMPVNVKYTADAPNLGGVGQDLYHGTSLQQLQGLVDLLMNYPRYARSRALVSGLVRPAAVPENTEVNNDSDTQ